MAADLRQHLVEISLAVPRNERAAHLARCRPRRGKRRSRRGCLAAARPIVAVRHTDRDRRLPCWRAAPLRRSAAGLSSVPLRPMNSCRSPVQSVWRPARSAKATRDPNAACHGLRANIAPVSGSISVVTNCADVHCATDQAPIRRKRSAKGAAYGATCCSSVSREIFIGSPTGTYCSSSR